MNSLYRFKPPEPESKTIEVKPILERAKPIVERLKQKRLMNKVYAGLSVWARRLMEYNKRK